MKNKRERGEVVVEATIIVTIVMLIITIMLYVGMVLYQQSLISVMANQTASNIAQVYSNNIKDPFTGYIDSDKVYQSVTYGNMKTDAYMDVVEQKAALFAKYRLKSASVLAAKNTSVEVDIVKKQNELFKGQIVVTIRGTYDIPLVGFFGTDGLLEFAASGRADCVDILEYINGVDAVGTPENSNVSFLPDSKNCTITFIPDRNNASKSSTVTVLKGHSVLTSNKYTRSIMPTNPVNGNLKFAGWVTDTGSSFTATNVVNENITVYGSWQCTITLNAEGGSVNSVSQYKMNNVTIGSRVLFPNATRTNHSFEGWYTQKGGKGTKYLSNDTVITGNITLYAHWKCTHPAREEYKRTGDACSGGTIYYRCVQCHADMGTGSYGGNQRHSFTMRCDVYHVVPWFAGYGSGGCGSFHYYDSRYQNSNKYGLAVMKHNSPVGMYCQICKYCYTSRGYFWCGYHGSGRLPHAPSNGHQK